MQQKYYTVAFVDKTREGVLSNAKIGTGVRNVDSQSEEIMSTVAGRIGHKLSSQAINSVSSAVGFNLSPAVNLGKAIMSGAGAGAIAGAGVALANQVFSMVYNAIANRIAKLEQEAAEANERDNQLILSGNLDVSGCTIQKGKYGRDEYVYSRG